MALNSNWTPSFGVQYTWFGMDKHGKIGAFLNTCFGNIPRVLLEIRDIESVLDSLCEVVWNESERFSGCWEDKNGKAVLDLYSHAMFGGCSKDEVFDYLCDDLKKRGIFSEVHLAANKGLFYFTAVEGGADYPVGYDGDTCVGDYFRFLMPTVFASISDVPPPLRGRICVSDRLDFSQTNLIKNEEVDTFFSRMYEMP